MNTFSDRESLISSFMGCLRRASIASMDPDT